MRPGTCPSSSLLSKHHAELLTEVAPGGIAWCALGYQDGHGMGISEPLKAVAVAEYLAQAEPELRLFVLVGDALDLGDEDGPVRLQGKIEVWLLGAPSSGARSRRPEEVRANSFWVSACPLRPRSTRAGSTGERLPLGR